MLDNLADDLALQVIAAAPPPLARLLTPTQPPHPPRLLPLTLRALHPSIDSHASLCLSTVPSPPHPQPTPPHIGQVLPALATLSHLHTLALHNHSLPGRKLYERSRTRPRPLTHLSALRNLTSLSLRNSTFNRTHPQDLLCAIQSLPDLKVLDLSRCALGHMFLRLWMQDMSDTPHLRTLNLSHAISTPHILQQVTDLLGIFLKHDVLPEELCIGSRHTTPATALPGTPGLRPGTHAVRPVAHCPLFYDLLRRIRECRGLRSLTFDFRLHRALGDALLSIAATLASLTHLRHLGITDARLLNLHQPTRCQARQAPILFDGQVPSGSGLSALTQLTSLHCGHPCTAERGDMLALLATLPALRHLRAVGLPCCVLCDRVCAAAAHAAAALPGLTALRVRALAGSDGVRTLEVMRAAAELPALRALHGSLVVNAGVAQHAAECEEQLLEVAKALAGAAGEKKVWLDLRCDADDTGEAEGEAHGAINLLPAFACMAPLLPLCLSLTLRSRGAGMCNGVVAVRMHAMTALTRLTIELQPEPDAGGDPLAQTWRAVLAQMAAVTGLRHLSLASPRCAHGMNEGDLCGSLCAALPQLALLTCLKVTFRSGDASLVGRVLGACCRVPQLRRLRVALGNDWGVQHYMREDARGSQHHDMPLQWEAGGLRSLCSLSLFMEAGVGLGDEFWGGLSGLTQLRRLRLHVGLTRRRARNLAVSLEALTSLQELVVDEERAGVETVRDLEEGVAEGVRVCLETRDDVYDSDEDDAGWRAG